MSIKNKFKAAVLGTVFIGAVGGLTGCGLTYSEGDRVGPITKFSHKGFFAQSWEGEMAMDNMKTTTDGGLTNTFEFSVVDPKIVTQIQEAQEDGGRYKLHYKEVFKRNPFSTDSDYIIIGVEKMSPIQPRGTSPLPK